MATAAKGPITAASGPSPAKAAPAPAATAAKAAPAPAPAAAPAAAKPPAPAPAPTSAPASPAPEAAPKAAPDTSLTAVVAALNPEKILADAQKAEADARTAEMQRNQLAELSALRNAEIQRMLKDNNAPSAVALIEGARISGSPLHLVAAKLAAMELLPKVADAASASAPAGLAGSTDGALRPDQAPSSVKAIVGPGTARTTLSAEEVAVEGEEQVKMTFPRQVNLTLEDRTTVVFKAGVNNVPLSLSTHSYLLACGAKPVPAPETRVLLPVQFGKEGKTAPVTTK